MTKHTGNFHRNGYLMLHHLAGATLQITNLVNYNCHPSRGWQHNNNVRDFLKNSILPNYNLYSSGILIITLLRSINSFPLVLNKRGFTSQCKILNAKPNPPKRKIQDF